MIKLLAIYQASWKTQ